MVIHYSKWCISKVNLRKRPNELQADTGEREHQYSIDSVVTSDQVLAARKLRMAFGGLDPPAESLGEIKIEKIIPVQSVEPDPKELIYDDGYIQRMLDYYETTLQQIFPHTCMIRNRELRSFMTVMKGEKQLPRELLMAMRTTIEKGCKAWKANQVDV